MFGAPWHCVLKGTCRMVQGRARFGTSPALAVFSHSEPAWYLPHHITTVLPLALTFLTAGGWLWARFHAGGLPTIRVTVLWTALVLGYD